MIAVAIGISPKVEVKVTISGAVIPLTVAMIRPGLEEEIVSVGLPLASTNSIVMLISPTIARSSPCDVKL